LTCIIICFRMMHIYTEEFEYSDVCFLLACVIESNVHTHLHGCLSSDSVWICEAFNECNVEDLF